MRTHRVAGLSSFVAAALFLGQGAAQAPEQGKGGVDLRVVRYSALAQEVLKHRGKVIVLDFWQFL
jgi:hypothetical protein